MAMHGSTMTMTQQQQQPSGASAAFSGGAFPGRRHASTTDASTAVAVAGAAFLSSIRLRIDPAAPPPPLFPHANNGAMRGLDPCLPFAVSLDPISAVPVGTGASPEEWSRWSSANGSGNDSGSAFGAASAFLAHIPTGHERADQRPQPALRFTIAPQWQTMQQKQSQQQQSQSFDEVPPLYSAFPAGRAAAVSSSPLPSALCNPSLPFVCGPAQAAAPCARRDGRDPSPSTSVLFDGSDSAAPASGDEDRDRLLGANGEPLPLANANANASGVPPLTMRMQTPSPPPSSANGANLNAPADAMLASGALYPVTIGSPLDSRRMISAEQPFGAASNDGADRALSPADQLQLQPQQSMSSGSDDGSASLRTPKANHSRAAGGSSLAYGSNSLESSDSGPTSQQALTPAAFLRTNSTGHGLLDPDAHFVAARHPGQSSAEWERGLIDRGILDARIVFTPIAAGEHSHGHSHRRAQPQRRAGQQPQQQQQRAAAMPGPVWLSSLAAFVPRQHSSSNSSSAPSTPRAGGLGGPIRSRSGSFSLEPGGLLLGASLAGSLLGSLTGGTDQASFAHGHGHAHGHGGGAGSHGDGALSSLLGSGTVGNRMLAFGAAVAAAQVAQEASYENDDSLAESGFNMFGKKQGTSYAFLLRPFPAAPFGHSASGGGGGSGGGSSSAGAGGASSPTHKHKPSSLHLESGGSGGAGGSKDGGGSGGGSGGGGGGGGVSASKGDAKTLPLSSSAASSSSSRSLSSLSLSEVRSCNELYDPFYLDDPNVKSGKHRVVLQLSGFVSSLLGYVRGRELEAELNATFAARHSGWLNPALQMSLSKLRKCKQIMLDLVVRLDLEISTCAVAFVYFERLLLRNQVNKANRKIIAAVCLLLAFKWAEGSGGAQRQRLLSLTFAAMEKSFHAPRAAILKAEFPVLVALDLDLTVKTEHVLHHFRLCLSKLDTVPADYRNIEWSL